MLNCRGRHSKNLPGERTVTYIYLYIATWCFQPYNALGGARSGSPQLLTFIVGHFGHPSSPSLASIDEDRVSIYRWFLLHLQRYKQIMSGIKLPYRTVVVLVTLY